MSISITSATIYTYNKSKATLTSETAPAVSGSINFYRAGWASDLNTRYSTLLVCKSTEMITNLTLTFRTAGTDNTTASKLLGVVITTTKNDNYLKTTAGGNGIFRFNYEYDNGSYVGSSGSIYKAITNITLTPAQIIPANKEFYIYFIPYNDTFNFSTFYDAVKTTDTSLKLKFEPSYTIRYVKIYNGSSWVKAIPWIYNGSKWVRAMPWTYNGSWKIGIT